MRQALPIIGLIALVLFNICFIIALLHVAIYIVFFGGFVVLCTVVYLVLMKPKI